jgi:hypothetical protein
MPNGCVHPWLVQRPGSEILPIFKGLRRQSNPVAKKLLPRGAVHPVAAGGGRPAADSGGGVSHRFSFLHPWLFFPSPSLRCCLPIRLWDISFCMLMTQAGLHRQDLCLHALA